MSLNPCIHSTYLQKYFSYLFRLRSSIELTFPLLQGKYMFLSSICFFHARSYIGQAALNLEVCNFLQTPRKVRDCLGSGLSVLFPFRFPSRICLAGTSSTLSLQAITSNKLVLQVIKGTVLSLTSRPFHSLSGMVLFLSTYFPNYGPMTVTHSLKVLFPNKDYLTDNSVSSAFPNEFFAFDLDFSYNHFMYVPKLMQKINNINRLSKCVLKMI